MTRLVAVVTGASRGIGLACVRKFLDAGFQVIGVDKSPAEQQFLNYSHVIADFGDVAAVEKSASAIVDLRGRVDVLVNNAGLHPPPRTILDAEIASLSQLMQINVFAAFALTRKLLPTLRESRGSVVMVSSLVASIGQEASVEYCMTKGALLAMTKALAIDEGTHGVRVNSVSPGAILTPLAEELNSREELSAVARWSWLDRLGTADEVAGTVHFLTSSDAGFITGQDIVVSGGAELGYGTKAQR